MAESVDEGVFFYVKDLIGEYEWTDHSFITGCYSILYVVIQGLLLSLLLFFLATCLWRLYYELAWDPDSKLPLPLGCMGFPFVGETLSCIKSNTKFNISRREQYGRIHKTHLFGHPAVKVIGSQNVRPVLMGEHMTVEASWPASVKALIGKGGISTSTYDNHRIRKKLLLKAMSPAVIAMHVPDIQELVRRHLQEWCTKGEQLGHDACRRLAMMLAVNILIGFRIDDEKLKMMTEEFRIYVDNMFSLPLNIPGTRFSKALKARGRILTVIRDKLLLETKQWSLVDELRSLNQTIVSLSHDEMADAVLELWFAGNDTSTSAACSVLLALGSNAEVRSKVKEELNQHGLLEPEAELTYSLLQKLKYVDYVLKEVLRLWPPVGLASREVKRTMELEGYQIPKGWQVLYCIRDTHETTEIFDKKDVFLPERWLEMEEKIQDISERFHYIPFGAGARACPGEHFAKTFIKIFIVELVRTCHWELKHKTTEINYFPLPLPADGLPVTFTFKNRKASSVTE